MPKQSKVEACVFCEQLPCACAGLAKRSARKPKKLATPALTDKVTIQLGGNDDPFADVHAAPRVTKFAATSEHSQVLPYPDREALRTLASSGLLAQSETARIDKMLRPPLGRELDIRLVEWRKRNEVA